MKREEPIGTTTVLKKVSSLLLHQLRSRPHIQTNRITNLAKEPQPRVTSCLSLSLHLCVCRFQVCLSPSSIRNTPESSPSIAKCFVQFHFLTSLRNANVSCTIHHRYRHRHRYRHLYCKDKFKQTTIESLPAQSVLLYLSPLRESHLKNNYNNYYNKTTPVTYRLSTQKTSIQKQMPNHFEAPTIMIPDEDDRRLQFQMSGSSLFSTSDSSMISSSSSSSSLITSSSSSPSKRSKRKSLSQVYSVMYEAENHGSVLLQTYGSIWSRVLPYCIINTAFMYALVYLRDKYDLSLTISNEGHTYVSVVVSFLLVSSVELVLQQYADAREHLCTIYAQTRKYDTVQKRTICILLLPISLFVFKKYARKLSSPF